MSTQSADARAILDVADLVVELEDVVDRKALEELCQSTHSLFGIGVRVYSAAGALLASAADELEVCRYVNQFGGGHRACGSTVDAAKSVDPGLEGQVTHPCFTGLAYRIVSLEYETRQVGRIVLGPYAPAGLREAPPSLLQVEPRTDADRTRELLARIPRVKTETLARIARHLKTTLELIVFSSHKAYLTSKLHLYSVRESYRELSEKTARLEQALARLRELDRLKSNFLATISHELRTPLTSIIGYSEMLAEGIAGPLGEEQADFVRTIHEKGDQLLKLILGLLDLSKLESGTMSFRSSPMFVAPVLADVVATLTPVARKKGVELALERDAIENVEVLGDPERLRQVFVNLVDNAVKFTPKAGRVLVRARLARLASESAGDDDDEVGAVLLAPVRRWIEVDVADTGIGIPESERGRVFDAFYQVDSSSTREYGGTGLGLSIVKRIVDAHGGTIRIESNEPQGTVVIVAIPSTSVRRERLAASKAPVSA